MTEEHQLVLTGDELTALRRIISDWLSDGFITPPYPVAYATLLAKITEDYLIYGDPAAETPKGTLYADEVIYGYTESPYKQDS